MAEKIAVTISDARYEALFELYPESVARIDADGLILDANPTLISRSEFSRENLVGHHISEFGDAQTVATMEELVAELRLGRPAVREVRLKRRGGVTVWRSCTVIPTLEAGRVAGGFIVLHDITERIEADQIMRSLFAHHPHGIGKVDSAGNVLEVNDALVRMSGFTREELVAANFMDFAGPDTSEHAAQALRSTLQGEPQTAEVRPYKKDGTRGYVQMTTIPIRLDDSIVGAYIVFEDIEHRKTAQHMFESQAALLKESEERFRSLFAQNPDAVIAMDREGIILDANDALLTIGGYPREQVIGQNFRGFLSPAELSRVEVFLRRVLDGEAVNYEFIYQSPHRATPSVLEVTSFPMLSGGRNVGVYAIMQDATAEREASHRADAQSQRIRELYLVAGTANIADPQIITMLETGCRLLDMQVGAIVDCTRDCEVEHRYYATAAAASDDTESLTALASEVVLSQKAVTFAGGSNVHGRYRSGIAVPLIVSGQMYGALCFAGLTEDRSSFEETDVDLVSLIAALLGGALERRRSRANLKTLAYFDSLTGLPNRVFFQERLRDAVEAAQTDLHRVAVIFIDLDRFKDVNDTLGHALGDRLLQLVATRLVEAVRDRGIVARMGGDEFVVLLNSCESLDEIRKAAEDFLAVIDGAYQIDEYEQFITASAGISIYPDDGKDDQTLIKNADIAMYRAKDLGRNAYQLYAPSLEATIQMRLSQEKLLRRALEREEFVVHYQPQVDMLTGRIVALEALVRWNHPKTGIIFPGRFIPSAEMSGLIVPLGDWVLRKATMQLSAWQVRYPGMRIAVNLSAKQFHQPDLRARILSAVNAAKLDPDALEMEITESVAMTDAASSVQIMRDLVDSGVRIGLDDFGTGYSSLSYLRRFPAAVLKIDRSFVTGIGTEANDETIVITVIAMAHNLGLEVVAEGVETAEQYDFLRTYGCDRVQGYYISPAVPVSGIEELMAEWRPHPS